MRQCNENNISTRYLIVILLVPDNDLFQFGRTAAHRAAILGCVMSVSVLLKSGANFRLKDDDGHTPLDLASRLSHEECLNIAKGTKPPLDVPRTPRSNRGNAG